MAKDKKTESSKAVEQRKREHIQIPLKEDVSFKTQTNLFEDVILLHNALPEIDRSDVDTSAIFLKHHFSAPFMVSGMTGGAKEASVINKNIAKACQKLGLGMGLGSLKAMILEPSLTYSYQVRDVAPDIFLAGNIGANDLGNFPVKVLKKALKDVGANVLAVHLNSAQELVQKEGQANFKGVWDLIAKYSEKMPIYVKEVGQGISASVAKKLAKTNILAIDVAGAGGTNWIKIEYMRRQATYTPFLDWGIPTAFAVYSVRQSTKLPIVATGGIKTGEDVVKALLLGANLGAGAVSMLRSANTSYEAVEEELSRVVKEIGDVMFLLGAKNIKELKKVNPIIVGRLRELIQTTV
jgi:isopentenyl-diphosphate delta-isomerase